MVVCFIQKNVMMSFCVEPVISGGVYFSFSIQNLPSTWQDCSHHSCYTVDVWGQTQFFSFAAIPGCQDLSYQQRWLIHYNRWVYPSVSMRRSWVPNFCVQWFLRIVWFYFRSVFEKLPLQRDIRSAQRGCRASLW